MRVVFLSNNFISGTVETLEMSVCKSTPTVRPATSDDIEALHRVIVSAFGIQEGSERWTAMRNMAQGWSSFVVMERSGETIGAARIGRDRLRLGRTSILKGDVGYVSIVRELQGQGLGTILMRETLRSMEEEGFHLSRLGGLNAFYARFGYVPFPRMFYEFPIESIHAGAAMIEAEALLQPSKEEMKSVRPFDPDSDWSERCRLFDAFNAGRTGSLVENRPSPPPQWNPDPDGTQWVCAAGKRLTAYAFAFVNGAQLDLFDAGCEPGRSKELASTIKRVLLGAVRKGATQATGRLPFDAGLESALTEGGVPHVLREVQTALASNMLAIVNLCRFVGEATSEWSDRLQDAGSGNWEGVVSLAVAQEKVNLCFSRRGIRIADAGDPPHLQLTLSPRAFLLGVLGYRDWHELTHESEQPIPPALSQTLSILFRREPIASGPLG